MELKIIQRTLKDIANGDGNVPKDIEYICHQFAEAIGEVQDLKKSLEALKDRVKSIVVPFQEKQRFIYTKENIRCTLLEQKIEELGSSILKETK